MASIDVSDRIRPNDVYPYDEYTVILKSLAHINYAYRIKGQGIQIELSDYLEEAPDNVLRDVCRSIVQWSLGRRFSAPQSLSDYIHSDSFIVSNRPKYLRRSRSFLMSQQGRNKNLIDSVERLMYNDLVYDDDIRNSYFTWATHMAKYRFGQCNQTFRVVSVNPILDSDDIPDHVLDYVVYHEILHLRQDMSKKHRPHNAQFKSWEHMFPGYEEANRYLRNIYSSRGPTDPP